MDVVTTLTVLLALPLLLLPYLVFKALRHVKRTIFSENVAGKVILITGASSGIGEHIAYEYARKGARLALAARREDRLQAVADKARKLGSPDVIAMRTDVSRIEDCKRFIDEAFNHFGRLDHLVNNAGIAPRSMLEDCYDFSSFVPVMDVNFWGSVRCSQLAVPYLRKNRGKIVVIASIAPWLSTPKLSFYNASKAALISFYETMRIECGSHIGITIVIPGLIESEITTPDFLSEFGAESAAVESTQVCAKAIVNSARRGDMYLTVPSGMKVMFLLKTFCPELLERLFRWHMIDKRRAADKKA
ncbi:hypothetical protein JCGZ_26419 [Jatropha curcas]|uniref:Uncharacterized protein n=1 Tax=Jatropha curcas TaxID=180498 RepID=A0A067JID3_JATCU|nr:hypothetical protein JCGZ_26419 [Jatropha curcas]